MKTNRVLALVVGCLLLLPGIGLLGGGIGLGAAYAFDRDDDGYFSSSVEGLESQTVAITAEDLDLVTDPGSPDWLLDRLDADVRLEVTGPAGAPLFVGIGPASDVDAYLAGVAHDQVIGSTSSTPAYRRTDGQSVVGSPSRAELLGRVRVWCRHPATGLDRHQRTLGGRADERRRFPRRRGRCDRGSQGRFRAAPGADLAGPGRRSQLRPQSC